MVATIVKYMARLLRRNKVEAISDDVITMA
jgi:hypothetical protein